LVSYTVVPPLSLIFSPWPLRPPHSPLFPYTTLFRSGFCFLTYMAITLWFIKPQTAHAPVKLNPFKQIGFALSVSLLNPHAILDRSEEHTSELQSRFELVCRLLLQKKKDTRYWFLYHG